MGSSAVGIYTAGRAQRQLSRFSLSVEGDDLLFTLQLERRMRVKRWLLAGIALCLLTGCVTLLNRRKIYAGLANLASALSGDGRARRAHHRCNKRRAKKWRRVQQNDVLENGWTILH